jgi:hypothetical protein
MNTILIAITVCSVGTAIVMAAWALRLWREQRLRSDVRVALLTEMAREQGDPPLAVASDLFHAQAEPSAWPRRAAIAFAMLAAAALAVFAFNVVDGALPRPAGNTASDHPLELVTLSHAQEAGTLIVRGLVQNPGSGRPQSRAVATAVLLDADGQLVATGRSPLDIARLEPGDQSPFVIRVPAPRAVARYRVSFRAADDTPLPHVDRRDPSLARKEAP